jgi:hypothetical protein
MFFSHGSRKNILAAPDGVIKTEGKVSPRFENRKRKHLMLVHFLYRSVVSRQKRVISCLHSSLLHRFDMRVL